jgi:hypothetical protein
MPFLVGAESFQTCSQIQFIFTSFEYAQAPTSDSKAGEEIRKTDMPQHKRQKGFHTLL